MTSTPLRARLSAVFRPRPRLPPVTIAIFMFSPGSCVATSNSRRPDGCETAILRSDCSEILNNGGPANGPLGCDEDVHARRGAGELHQGGRFARLAEGERLDCRARPGERGRRATAAENHAPRSADAGRAVGL